MLNINTLWKLIEASYNHLLMTGMTYRTKNTVSVTRSVLPFLSCKKVFGEVSYLSRGCPADSR